MYRGVDASSGVSLAVADKLFRSGQVLSFRERGFVVQSLRPESGASARFGFRVLPLVHTLPCIRDPSRWVCTSTAT